MDLQVSGVRYDVSDKVREYVDDKLGGLRRFASDMTHLHVTIHEAPNFGFRVDVEMHLPNHDELAAHAEGSTVYAAIDGVTDKAASQLRKIHNKRSDHRSDRLRVRG